MWNEVCVCVCSGTDSGDWQCEAAPDEEPNPEEYEHELVEQSDTQTEAMDETEDSAGTDDNLFIGIHECASPPNLLSVL